MFLIIDVFSVSVIKYFLSLMPSPCLTTPTTQTEKSLFCKFKEVTIFFYESSVPNPNKIVLESICIITLSLLPIPVGLLVLPCTRHCRRYPPPPFHPPPFFPVRTEEPVKADTCACDSRAQQQLALIVHVKHSDLICIIYACGSCLKLKLILLFNVKLILSSLKHIY